MGSWTFRTLKEHFDQRFTDQDKAVSAALQAAEKAVGKAEAAAEKRFDAVNEFRGMVTDRDQFFVQKAEHHALEEKVDSLSARMDRNEGRGSGFSSGWVYLLGAVGLAVELYLLFKR